MNDTYTKKYNFISNIQFVANKINQMMNSIQNKQIDLPFIWHHFIIVNKIKFETETEDSKTFSTAIAVQHHRHHLAETV